MNHTTIQSLRSHAGKEVTLRGWVQGVRSSGKIRFITVRDGTGTCQCIVEAAHPAAFEVSGSLTQETSVILSGTVRLEERAPGGCEIDVTGLSIVHLSESDYPISRKAHGVDFLMSHRHLWLRSQRQAAILKIRHTIIRAARGYFDDAGFTLIDTPILQPDAAEGASTLFPVNYFGDEVYLAQTGQLYLESACMALANVYCFGPTFRAEKSKTRRHLTEFWMIEPEIAYADLPVLKLHAEGLICRILKDVLANHLEDLKQIGRDVSPLQAIEAPFPSLTYSEAVDLLHSEATRTWLEQDLARLEEQHTSLTTKRIEVSDALQAAGKAWKKEKLERELHELDEQIREIDTDIGNRRDHMKDAGRFEWGRDFGGDEETILSKQFDRPLFITEYPKSVKAFYMKQHPENPDVVLNTDVLAPEGYGEIIGGSVREDNLPLLEKRIHEEGMEPDPYQWYMDLRRYGSIPHGGFGLGIERTVAWICGLKHVRETIPFPRLMGRLTP